MMSSEMKRPGECRDTLHAISLLRECLDNQFLVILSPSIVIGHDIDLGPDIFYDIFLVPSLVMKGDAERCQRLETIAYVDLRPTSNTYMEFREAEINEVFYKAENSFSWRSHAGGIGTFIKSVYDDVNWVLGRS